VKIRLLEDSAKTLWEDRLVKTRYPSVYQSWEWGEHKKRAGWQPERWFFETGSDEDFWICQFLVKKKPLGFRLVWAPGGPCGCSSSHWPPGLSQGLWQAARAGNPRAYFRCDPYEPLEADLSQGQEETAPLHRPRMILNSAVSVWLELNGSDEALIQGMKKNHRYRLRQAQRADLTWSHEKTPKAMNDLARILHQVRQIKSIRAATLASDEIENLAGDLGAKAQLTVGYLDGIPVAGALCLLQGSRAWYSYAGCNLRGREVSASYALVLEAAKEARRGGAKYFDLAGVSPGKVRYAGVNDFKKGFGGREVRLSGEWEAGGWLARLVGNAAVLLKRG